MKYLGIYLLTGNLIAFALYGIDKGRAKRKAWRIPERVLMLAALLGGSVGALGAMALFRHKTKHKKFTVGVPAILVCQLAAAAYLLAKSRGVL